METNQPFLPLPELQEADTVEITVRQGLRQCTLVYSCRPGADVVAEFDRLPAPSLRHQLLLWWDAP